MGNNCTSYCQCQNKNDPATEIVVNQTYFLLFYLQYSIQKDDNNNLSQIVSPHSSRIEQVYNPEKELNNQMKQSDDLVKQNKAAINIQRRWKGFQTRKKINKKERQSFDKQVSGGNQKYFDNSEVAENDYPDQKREKRAPYKFKSGAIYEGDWKGNQRDGFGVQKWQDGAKYEGQWRDNKACGHGKFYHVDGDIFDGQWKDDKANGYGVYTHINGAKYEGYWKDDLQHGKGTEICKVRNDKIMIKGLMDLNMLGNILRVKSKEKENMNGRIVVFMMGNGTIIKQMDMYLNKLTIYLPQGIYKWSDGRGYEGTWLNNNMHGKGVYTWKDGRKYEGEYFNDKKQGYGVYTWADGRRYEGEWHNGKQHGKGKYVLSDGQVRVGFWQDGKRIRWENNDDKDNENQSSQF